jgi:uroporphyrinogen-III decarboxylase
MSNVTDNQRLYQEREKRVHDAISLQKPDRVPIVTLTEFFFLRAAGITAAEGMYDYQKMSTAWKASMKRFNWDMAPLQHAIRPGPVMEMLGLKMLKWPGYNLGENQYYQYVEKEYMLEDEYDEFLRDPSDFIIRKVLPRYAEIFEPLQRVPSFVNWGAGYAILPLVGMFGSIPPIVEMMDSIKAVGQEYAKWNAVQSQLIDDLQNMGYPVLTRVLSVTAFDWISDFLRGMKGSMLDMRRQPDKLKAAVEILEPLTIQLPIMMAAITGTKRVYIPLHRGARGFMSDAQYAEFYWPGLKKLLVALIEAGLTPLPFFEGDYTPRLHYLAELPPGKIMAHFDSVDRQKFKEVLGDTLCFWGNVSAQLLCTGTPQQVKDEVKELIDLFADSGGLIVDASSTGPPPEAKPENVEAMTETVFEYGKY